MKANIIARVSTEEQKEAGNSLPAQLTRLEKYCQKITEVYYDKKLKENRNMQTTLQKKLEKLQVVDERYYIASD